ncbi:hypothetical protein QYE76_051682 [Lolium multiflorum]|uniref:HVA22-like protein n=1 Tax=Lolium multiflorum TaxID=4521 RepID=A0AAD8SSB0_LOLMU|nr:hypothetical protein QYE76_051682 [Lolium multiflorum]
MRMRPPRPGWGRWRSGTPVDCFHDLLGLPVEFEVEMPPRVPSARYASVRAIETKSSVDDQQWLTYWVLYSFITLFELTFAAVIEWLPIWSYGKLFFNCWLVLPYFNGAAHVYEHFVRPVIVNQQVVNIWYIPKKEDSGQPEDVISAAQKYIKQNGSEAFEALVNKLESGNWRGRCK